jgi:DNA helicase-2/ATP-dependent DNA helicase PcrA
VEEVDSSRILAGLNTEQRRAVASVRGPLCILAGAGTGKTTTITRRIAAQVSEDVFAPGSILAVTFTDKAASEMRRRLSDLGAAGVRARTFHAAALAQLHHLRRDPLGQVLPSKTPALRRIGNSLPKPYRFRPAADLASEIERAKNRRVAAADYLDSLADHTPPIPADLMSGVYRRYERGKRERGLVDFEDLIEMAISMFEDDPVALERFQERYRTFTVDEYQDVNLLQQSLLDVWLGSRDEICVVGDDYQSIYAFTGAGPHYLLDMARRYPNATVVRLETNYRSTPQVLDVANRLAPMLGGASKQLRPSRPAGPPPVLQGLARPEDEVRFVVDAVRRLHDSERVRYEDMAILYRINSRSEAYEAALSSARIPFSVRGGALLARQAARRMITRLERSSAAGVAASVRALAERDGWIEAPPEGLGEREMTRQADLAYLVRLAEELDDPAATGRDFVATLRARFDPEGDGEGVNLLTYHRAKGLEFEVVFLPGLVEGELPFRRVTAPEGLAEERRLFYVGVTRARRHLFITWSTIGSVPSSFLEPLVAPGAGQDRPAGGRLHAERHARLDPPDDGAVAALKEWRLQRARRDGVPPFVVLHDRTVDEIARRRPRTAADLVGISGIGPTKLGRYGAEILEVLSL